MRKIPHVEKRTDSKGREQPAHKQANPPKAPCGPVDDLEIPGFLRRDCEEETAPADEEEGNDEIHLRRADTRRADWILFSHKRRMGRAVTSSCAGLYRVALSGGRRSDLANLSWTKNHVWETALRDLVWESAHDPANSSGIATPKSA